MEYTVLQSECVLAARRARDPHGDPGVASSGLAAFCFNGVGHEAFLNLFFSQGFEFEVVQFDQGSTNIGVVADFTRFDFLCDQGLDGFFNLLPVIEVKHRFVHPFAPRLFRADPAFARIPVIAKSIEVGF